MSYLAPVLGSAPRRSQLLETASVEVVLFDLDGCLVDSRAAIARCINHALEAVGLPAQDERDLHRYIGPPMKGSFADLLVHMGGPPELAERCVVAYRDVYPQVSVEHTAVVPGMKEALARLTKQVATSVVTSKPREFAVPLLAAVGLDRWFGEVFGHPWTRSTSPSPTPSSGRSAGRASDGTPMCPRWRGWSETVATTSKRVTPAASPPPASPGASATSPSWKASTPLRSATNPPSSVSFSCHITVELTDAKTDRFDNKSRQMSIEVLTGRMVGV